MPIDIDIKILYVEDEFITRQEVKMMLRSKYKNVVTAKNGVEGYDMYKKEHPDLIITDLKMPGMDGIELVKKVRAEDKKIPIIIASAFEKEFFKFNDMDIQEYIIKPIARISLLIMIEDVMSNREKNESQTNS